jgi:MobA/MobL family
MEAGGGDAPLRRGATASAAYRSGRVIVCDREGRVHDYSRKQGVESSFILAPNWAQDRATL